MSKKLKAIIFSAVIVSIVTAIMIIQYNSKLNSRHYVVNCFNDSVKINAMSEYNDGKYYYIDNNTRIYEISSDNQSENIISTLNEGTHILGMTVFNDSVYYIANEELRRYDINTKETEISDDEYSYQYISSDKENVYASGFKNADLSDYRILRINKAERDITDSDDSYADTDIKIVDKDNYRYFLGYNPNKSFIGICSDDNKVLFRSNYRGSNNLLYSDENIVIVSDDECKNLLSYNHNGKLVEKINMPKDYTYIPANVYDDTKSIYMLLQCQNGTKSFGFYNLSQKRHKSDMIIKYDIESGNFETVYKSDNKHERIIGYKNGYIILLHNNCLYRINENTKEKEKLSQTDFSEAVFEVCYDKIFVWDSGNRYICSYDIV